MPQPSCQLTIRIALFTNGKIKCIDYTPPADALVYELIEVITHDIESTYPDIDDWTIVDMRFQEAGL